jgi:protein-disulfide isomerase
MSAPERTYVLANALSLPHSTEAAMVSRTPLAQDRTTMPHYVRAALLLMPLATGAGAAANALAAGASAAPLPTVATIGTERIDTSMLADAASATFKELEQQEAAERSRVAFEFAQARDAALADTVNRLVDDRVIEREATATHTDREALLGAVAVAPVTSEEIERFYHAREKDIGKPLAEVETPIRRAIETMNTNAARRAYIDGLRVKYHAAVVREPMRVAISGTGPVRGDAGAHVSIVEFADFQCPYCARLEPALREVLEAHPREVRVVFRHLPLRSIHPNADVAARAAVCAEQQGHFWELHDAMFAQQSELSEDALLRSARKLGLDEAAFRTCLATPATAARVAEDEAAATRIGFSGTPALFVNGRFHQGTMSFEELDTLVREELATPRTTTSPGSR